MISLIHGLGLSLQTGDSDELIIPLSCNYTPPPQPSFTLSLALLSTPLHFFCLFLFTSHIKVWYISPPPFFLYIILCVHTTVFDSTAEESLADWKNENTECAFHGLYRYRLLNSTSCCAILQMCPVWECVYLWRGFSCLRRGGEND